MGGERDRRIVDAICRWFSTSARPLPWRTNPRAAYPSFVSEMMLQQTQMARVLGYFETFLTQFPSIEALANAEEQHVLAAWSGLGYYRRARFLYESIRIIAREFDGRFPSDVASLMELPGVGRYTAGAIASIVFDRPAAIVDGNVARVLLRLEGKDLPHRDQGAWAWRRAGALVALTRPGTRAGPAKFNEGLMELGATVCTPRRPRCHECPLARSCRARRLGLQDVIPRAKPKGRQRPLYCDAVLVRDRAGRVLVERRPEQGMWAGMWQAPTVEGSVRRPRGAVEAAVGIAPLSRRDRFDHTTTHRLVRFTVWEALASKLVPGPRRVWCSRRRIADLPLSNPQRRILLARASPRGSWGGARAGRKGLPD